MHLLFTLGYSTFTSKGRRDGREHKKTDGKFELRDNPSETNKASVAVTQENEPLFILQNNRQTHSDGRAGGRTDGRSTSASQVSSHLTSWCGVATLFGACGVQCPRLSTPRLPRSAAPTTKPASDRGDNLDRERGGGKERKKDREMVADTRSAAPAEAEAEAEAEDGTGFTPSAVPPPLRSAHLWQ